MRARKTIIILAIATSAIFLAGLAHLVNARFEAGDIYPPYSSLRADPLGTKALYEALKQLNDLDVTRNYKVPYKTETLSANTLLLLGVNTTEPKSTSSPAQTQPSSSPIPFSPRHRVVISLHPNAIPSLLPANITSDIGVSVSTLLPGSESGMRTATPTELIQGRDIPWHSDIFFADLAPEWRVLYACDGSPVIIERDYPDGSLVLCADSFFLSNEAMVGQYDPVLLARLIHGKTVVFDESHLGVLQETGIATLARQYRLELPFLVLLCVAALVIWRNASSFIPRGEGLADPDESVHGEGKASASGLLNLIRKAVGKADLLDVCFKEYKRGITGADTARRQAAAAIEAIVQEEQSKPARQRDPVKAYQAICKALNNRRRRGT